MIFDPELKRWIVKGVGSSLLSERLELTLRPSRNLQLQLHLHHLPPDLNPQLLPQLEHRRLHLLHLCCLEAQAHLLLLDLVPGVYPQALALPMLDSLKCQMEVSGARNRHWQKASLPPHPAQLHPHLEVDQHDRHWQGDHRNHPDRRSMIYSLDRRQRDPLLLLERVSRTDMWMCFRVRGSLEWSMGPMAGREGI
jgi:hypothetical protein